MNNGAYQTAMGNLEFQLAKGEISDVEFSTAAAQLKRRRTEFYEAWRKEQFRAGRPARGLLYAVIGGPFLIFFFCMIIAAFSN